MAANVKLCEWLEEALLAEREALGAVLQRRHSELLQSLRGRNAMLVKAASGVSFQAGDAQDLLGGVNLTLVTNMDPPEETAGIQGQQPMEEAEQKPQGKEERPAQQVELQLTW